MSSTDSDSPWYRDGLAFECTRCGACCTGAPGYVWVSPEEIARLAGSRGEPVDRFSEAFVRRVGNRYSLIEKPGGDCVFWDRAVGCTVYEVRPVQCRTWPFWEENVESPEAWEYVGRGCPGIDRGRVFTAEEVLAAVARTPG